MMGLITVSWKVNELVSWRKWKISLRNVSNVIHCEWLLFRLIRSLSAYLRHDNFHEITKGWPPSTKRDSGDSICFEWTDQILWNCVGAFLNSYFVACCVLLYYCYRSYIEDKLFDASVQWIFEGLQTNACWADINQKNSNHETFSF